jgi:DNA-binding transcriptional MerR regulator
MSGTHSTDSEIVKQHLTLLYDSVRITGMKSVTEPLWTLEELGAHVALALAVDYEGQPSGRVRDVPDRRTIRYYTTLGLLDRPATLRGRTGLYGRRHLLQIVAIKRLQVRGLALAEIQHRLLGLPDARLEKLARLPGDIETPTVPTPKLPDVPAESESERRHQSFWMAAPESGAKVQSAVVGEDDDQATSVSAEPSLCIEPPATVLQGIRLAADVTLLLPAERTLETDDIEAIRIAAAPLLKLLEKRRLLGPHHEGGKP